MKWHLITNTGKVYDATEKYFRPMKDVIQVDVFGTEECIQKIYFSKEVGDSLYKFFTDAQKLEKEGLLKMELWNLKKGETIFLSKRIGL